MNKEQLINSMALKIASIGTVAPVQQIKDLLTMELYGYEISELRNTELAISDEYSTEALMKYFAIGKLGANKSEGTIEQYRRAVYQLCSMVGKSLSDITSEDVQYYLVMYRRRHNVKESTMESRRLYLSSVFSYLYKHKKIKENPMAMIEPIAYRKCVKTPLTDEEIERIRVACGSERRSIAIVDFFLDTGVRVSELCGVKLQDIDFDKNRCKVLGKGNKERFVYFSGKTKVRLKEYLQSRADIKSDDGTWSYNPDTPLFASYDRNHHVMHKAGVSKIIKNLANKSNILRLHCHLFRATYATRLAQRGVDINIIARALGHANLNTISRYVLLSEEQIDLTLKQVGAA